MIEQKMNEREIWNKMDEKKEYDHRWRFDYQKIDHLKNMIVSIEKEYEIYCQVHLNIEEKKQFDSLNLK